MLTLSRGNNPLNAAAPQVSPGLYAGAGVYEAARAGGEKKEVKGKAGKNKPEKPKWWQYYPKKNPKYKSRWLIRGVKPPYKPGEEARRALNLPRHNPGDAVREVDVKPWEIVRGPRNIEGGTGQEYYRGWRWPK